MTSTPPKLFLTHLKAATMSSSFETSAFTAYSVPLHPFRLSFSSYAIIAELYCGLHIQMESGQEILATKRGKTGQWNFDNKAGKDRAVKFWQQSGKRQGSEILATKRGKTGQWNFGNKARKDRAVKFWQQSEERQGSEILATKRRKQGSEERWQVSVCFVDAVLMGFDMDMSYARMVLTVRCKILHQRIASLS
jgi:hypothetical protein